MTYTHFDCSETHALALNFARGSFQVGLLNGDEAWSAMTVVGNAANYRGRYVLSGENLIARLKRGGFDVVYVRGHHNRREYKISLSNRACLNLKLATIKPDTTRGLDDLRISA